MAAEDYFDPYGFDDDDDEDIVVCPSCGEEVILWAEKGILLSQDTGKRHLCPPSADDFEDVS